MLKILCCDDNSVYLDKLENIIQTISKKHSLPCKISHFTSGEGLLFHLKEQINYADIIFLDILMAKKNGIETAYELRKMGCKAEIIFITSSLDYVLNSFDAHPLNYLVKNTTKLDKFEEVFLQAASLAEEKTKNSFLYESGGQTNILPLSKIKYFEVTNRIITIYTDDAQRCFYGKIDDIALALSSKNFARIHRSLLVNLNHIQRFSTSEVILVSGEQLPIGSKYFKDFKVAFAKFLA